MGQEQNLIKGNGPTGEGPDNPQRPGRLGFMAGWGWIVRGWDHYQANPLPWTLAIVCWFLLFFLLQYLLAFTAALTFILPMAGHVLINLLMPVLMGGLMLGCRAQEEGGNLTVKHLFAGFSIQTGGLMMVGVLYMAATFLLVPLTAAALFTFMGQSMPMKMEGMLAGQDLLLVMGLLLVVTLAIFSLIMAVIFAPALVALDGIGAWQAVKLSFKGGMTNLMPLTLHGFVALVLLFLGALPAGLGLLVVLPVLIASIYAAYDDIFHAEV
jgi:uncharacterized membrane protein